VSNPTSLFRCLKFLLPSLAHDKSFAWFQIPEFESEVETRLAFAQEGSQLLLLCSNGRLHRVAFDPLDGGSMALQETLTFSVK
jgi:hypothetical protein